MKVIAGQNGGGGIAVASNVTTKRVGSGEHMLLFYFFLVGVSFVLAWLVSIEKPYTAGSDIGYNIGLAGGIAMCLLLLYSVRKRIRWLRRLFPLRLWFRIHMILGIVGPILILFHFNLEVRSANGAIAFYTMLLVFISGILGRFIYTRIHHGLYGSQTNFKELKDQLGMSNAEMHSKFHFAPSVEERLQNFESAVLGKRFGLVGAAWRFFTLTLRANLVFMRSRTDLKRALKAHAKKRGWKRSRYKRRVKYANEMIWDYIRNVQVVAQFRGYERLFSLWHILHVPLMFLLLLSGGFHVWAVHWY